jgi:hypothetical protein
MSGKRRRALAAAFRKCVPGFAHLKRFCTAFKNAAHFFSDAERETGIRVLKRATAIPKLWDARAVKGSDYYLLRIGVHDEIRVMGDDDDLSRLFSSTEVVDRNHHRIHADSVPCTSGTANELCIDEVRLADRWISALTPEKRELRSRTQKGRRRERQSGDWRSREMRPPQKAAATKAREKFLVCRECRT